MARYLLIESRDPFESGGVEDDYALAQSLAENGNEVVVFLVQNGVLPARRGARSEGLHRLVASGTPVLADAFSLRERALPPETMLEGIEASPLDVVLDAMVAGHKVIWL